MTENHMNFTAERMSSAELHGIRSILPGFETNSNAMGLIN
jgi:hypothetical protein